MVALRSFSHCTEDCEDEGDGLGEVKRAHGQHGLREAEPGESIGVACAITLCIFIFYMRATIGLLLTSVAPLSRARVSLPWQAAMPRDSPSTVVCNVVGVEWVGPMRVSSGWGDEAANAHVSAEGVGKWARDALRQVFVRGEGFGLHALDERVGV